MKLTRVIIKGQGRLRQVQADFRSTAGSRVRLNMGTMAERSDMLAILERVEAAAGDYRKLREVGRV